MQPQASDYIDLTLDWGFKRLMTQKDFLIRFLNALLAPRMADDAIAEIIDITRVESSSAPVTPTQSAEEIDPRSRSQSLPNPHLFPIEQVELLSESELGETSRDKSIIYDVVCLTRKGLWVNVEMQRAHQRYYLDRALFYSSRLISRQGHKGFNVHDSMRARVYGTNNKRSAAAWQYDLDPTYHIGILGFDYFRSSVVGLDSSFTKDCWLTWTDIAVNGNLCEPPKFEQTFHMHKLNMLFISLPRFNNLIGDDENIQSERDRLIWCLANLGKSKACVEHLPSWFESLKETFRPLKVENIDDVALQEYLKELHAVNQRHDELRTAEVSGMEKATQLIKAYFELKKEVGNEEAYHRLTKGNEEAKGILGGFQNVD